MKKNIIIILISLFVISLSSNAQILKKKIPNKLVVLTFDDAVASHYSNVMPLLKKYGFGATFFVCEFPDFHDTTKYMSWSKIQQLGKMGFDIGNHTHTHPNITRLNSLQIKNELKYIEDKCDSGRIKKPITFAYPAYINDSNSLEILKADRYIFARAGGNRVYDPLVDHPLLIPSYSITMNKEEQLINAFKNARGGKVVVVTIHGVPDNAHPKVSTPVDKFKRIIQYLHDNHYCVISLKDLRKYIDVERALNEIIPDFTKRPK